MKEVATIFLRVLFIWIAPTVTIVSIYLAYKNYGIESVGVYFATLIIYLALNCLFWLAALIALHWTYINDTTKNQVN